MAYPVDLTADTKADKTKSSSLASLVSSRKTAWADSRSALEESWLRWYRQWRMSYSEEDKSKASERSKIKMPATREAVRMAVDAIAAVVFSVTPLVDLESRTDRDHAEVEAVQKYISFLMDEANVEDKVSRLVLSAAIYGSGFIAPEPLACTEPYIDTDEEETVDLMGQVSVNKKRVYKETTIIRPTLRNLSIWDVFIPPGAIDVQSCEGVITRSIHSIKSLYKLQRAGVIKNIEMLDKSKTWGNCSSDSDAHKTDRLRIAGIVGDVKSSTDYEVFTYYGWVDNAVLEEEGLPEGEDGGMEMQVIVCQGVVLKAEPNPYLNGKRPLLHWPFEKVDGEFYGIGICEVAENPQRALDATVRTRIDNRAITCVPQFAINTRTFVEGQDLVSRAGKTWLFDGPVSEGDIRQLRIEDTSSTTHQDVSEYLQFIQSAHGISPLIGGMPSKGASQTAYEVGVLAQQASGRIRALCRDLEREVMEPVADWFFVIASQFLNVDEVLRITDYESGAVELMNVPAEILQGSFVFKSKGSTSVSLHNKLAKLMQFLAQTANPVDMQLVNRPHLLKRAYEALGFNDVDQVFAPQAAQAAVTPGSQTPANIPQEMQAPPGQSDPRMQPQQGTQPDVQIPEDGELMIPGGGVVNVFAD